MEALSSFSSAKPRTPLRVARADTGAMEGDFAAGQRTLPFDGRRGDFATGIRHASTVLSTGDFATGYRSRRSDGLTTGDFATGMRQPRRASALKAAGPDRAVATRSTHAVREHRSGGGAS
jgi:hypothetical protein